MLRANDERMEEEDRATATPKERRCASARRFPRASPELYFGLSGYRRHGTQDFVCVCPMLLNASERVEREGGLTPSQLHLSNLPPLWASRKGTLNQHGGSVCRAGSPRPRTAFSVYDKHSRG